MANNLRILYNNLADSATVTAASTAAEFPVSNMLVDSKGSVYRSTTNSAEFTINLPNQELVDSIVFPFCNLSTNATIRIRLYSAAVSLSYPILDTGYKPACPFQQIVPANWKGTTGLNTYSFGGGTTARAYLDTPTACNKIVVSFIDVSKPYLEFSRVVVANSWQPVYNTKFGISADFVDQSQQSRTQSGNLVTDNKPSYKTLNFDLEWLTPSDRTEFIKLVKTVGVKQSVFASIFPNNSDTEKESLYQIYGKFTNTATITHPMFTVYTTSISLEQI